MARRLIPPRTKERSIVIFKLTFIDIFLILFFIALLYLIAISNLPNVLKFILMGLTIIIALISMIDMGNGTRGYVLFINWIKYMFRGKKVPSVSFNEATGGKIEDKCVSLPDNYVSGAIEIHGIDFGILTEEKQDRIIHQLSALYKTVKFGKIVKIDKPLDVEGYLKQNYDKKTEWYIKGEYAAANGEKVDGYVTRMDILNNVDDILSYVADEEAIRIEGFYLIVYDISKDLVKQTLQHCSAILNNALIENKILNDDELKTLYHQYYNVHVDEQGDFFFPEIKEKANSLEIDGIRYRIASISSLPMYCGNAWLNELFRIPGTKVAMNFSSTSDKSKVVKSINKTFVELQSRYNTKGVTESEKLDIQNNLDSLGHLLQQLKLDNELLHETDYYIMYPVEKHKEVNDIFKNNAIYLDKLLFNQFPAYLNMNLYTPQVVKTAPYIKSINSTTLSATFPFVSKAFLDPKGNYLGESTYPVYFDLFYSVPRPIKKRTNANMCVFGKSGGGKSFFMKKLMMQQACDGVKVFILDPDNEYNYLCDKLAGNKIDVGGLGSGIINPLQVFPTLREEEDDGFFTKDVSDHRTFLQEWFKTVIPSLDPEAEPFLNEAIARVYIDRKIYDGCEIEKLSPKDFPIMNDLYNVISQQYEEACEKQRNYDMLYLRKLKNCLGDFKEGGVYGALWNGHTTFEVTNQFTVMNFQSLFSNSNMKVANGQMLLILRFLMQEVIKNRNNNLANNDMNKMVICIDEAHRFINPRFPVALTFMSDMIKRVRKYFCSMIVATQNLKDFIGQTEEMRVQASNVINGCQYSVIFGLMADDVNSVKDLYRSYNGGLTPTEVDFLTEAECGNALFMIDTDTRFIAKVFLYSGEESYIEKPKD